MDALGALLAEVGPEEEAVQVLQRAVELSPDRGHEKFMCGATSVHGLILPPCRDSRRIVDLEASFLHRYLGQLLDGDEGLQHLQRGVHILQAEVEVPPRTFTFQCSHVAADDS